VTGIAALLAAAEPIAGGFRTSIPPGWLQGRTAYGGLSGALALHAAQACAADLPPLRSALVAFIGPLAGDIAVTAQVLRRGRNAAFVQADVVSEAGLGYRATYTFMAERESAIALDTRLPAPDEPPEAEAERYVGPATFFTGNFEYHDRKRPLAPAEWERWVRLRERDGLDPAVELMAIADALPPAALKLLGGKLAPLSSLTWIVNLLTATPTTTDGWWLLSARSDHAHAGGSSQTMRLWNATGELVAEGMQSVAIFA
jgi:acyl-CoA thioesterase